MAIHFDALPGILLHPTETFKKLKEDANLADGLKIYLIFAVISSILSIVSSKVMASKTLAALPSYAASSQSFKSTLWALSDVGIIVSAIINLIVYTVLFVVFWWLVTKLAKAISGGKDEFSKTVGLAGHLEGAVTLFIGIPLSIIMILYYAIAYAPQATVAANPATVMPMLFGAISILILAILFLVWIWILAGKAVAAANDVSMGQGMVAAFLSVLVLGFTVLVIAIVVGLALLQAGMFGATGMAIAGL